MPDLSELLPMVALLFVIGGVAGVVAGLLGVGGGIVLVPAFFYAFTHLGYDGPQLMQICVATSLATIVVTSPRSVASHHKKGAVDWQMLRDWAPFIVAGALAGTLVAALVKSVVLQVVFGVLAGLAGLYMAFGRPSWRLGDAASGAAGARGDGLGAGVLFGDDGDRRRHVRGAADEPVWRADPPGRGHGCGVGGVDCDAFGAGVLVRAD